MKCIRAFLSDDGIISISPQAKVGAWADVTQSLPKVERIMPLVGWGQWHSLNRVSDGVFTQVYAVSE